MKQLAVIAVLLASSLSSGASSLQDNEEWLAEHRSWQKTRLARLLEPDGWLTLVGLHWLPSDLDGLTLGTDEDSDVRLSAGPEQLGVLAVQQGSIRLQRLQQLPENADPDTDTDSLLWFGEAALESRLQFGPWSVELIERDGRFALRERHAEAETRTRFAGLEAYPADRAWATPARFVAHQPERTLRMATVAGVDDLMANPGVLEFERDGGSYSLEALQFDGDDQLFVVFADRSNGRTTYGGGRFVYTALPDQQGQVMLDFNRAYNPPCVFTDYSTCPLPPPGNRLDLAVTAGERLPPEHP